MRVRSLLAVTSPLVGRRDLRLDFLRGFAVLAMVVDHVAGFSPLYALTGGNRFFVSAAEGFVFMSGLLVGVVYGGLMRREGWQAAARKALRRTFTLYALAVWLTLAFAAFSTALSLPWAPDLGETSVGDFILQTITFQRAYYLVDVMQLYTLLLLVTPLALWLLGTGRASWLLAASAGLWAAYQLSDGQLQIPWPIRDNVVFNFAAWQVLFFGAMAIGYLRLSGPRSETTSSGGLGRPRFAVPGGWLGPLTLALAGLIWLHLTDGAVLAQLGLVTDPAAALDSWFDKASLPPFRLAAAAIVFAFAWSLVSHSWPLSRLALGWLILPLGANALYAYTAHLFVAGALEAAGQLAPSVAPGFGFDLAVVAANGWSPTSSFVLQLVALAIVALVLRWRLPLRLVGWLGTAPIHVRQMPIGRPVYGTRLVWRASPSLLAIAGASVLSATALMHALPDTVAAHANGRAVATEIADSARSPRVAVTVTAKRRLADLAPTASAAIGNSLEAADLNIYADDSVPAAPAEAKQIAWPSSTPVPALAETRSAGPVLEDREFDSPTLGRTMPYGIYLPPGYCEDPTRRYPVVYLLHGGPTNYSEWPQLGIHNAVHDLVTWGQVQPMILVFAEGEGSYFFNHKQGPAWGDYVAFDLVKHIDQTERTIPGRASRVVAGLSMGGHGALQLALNYPDVFGVAAAHSPSLRSAEIGPDVSVFREAYEFFGSPEYYQRYDPLELVKTASVPPLAIWLDAGTDDPWLEQVDELHALLEQREWPHEHRISPGEHETRYWAEHLGEYVLFYSQHLER